MKFVRPTFLHESPNDYSHLLQSIEHDARVSHRSEDKSDGSVAGSEAFIRKIIKLGHESVLEHEQLSVEIDCDRGVSHELVRHRIGSYTQESTRYVNYGGSEIEFIDPFACPQALIKMFQSGLTERQIHESRRQFCRALELSEQVYQLMIQLGSPPEVARAVLPNALRTKIVATYNLRQWREILEKRTARAAHPQMREIMLGVLKLFQQRYPVFFEDFDIVEEPLANSGLGIGGIDIPTHANRRKS